jgi:hypothetical protein
MSDAAALPRDLALAVERVRLRIWLRLEWLLHLASQGRTEVEIALTGLDEAAAEARWAAEEPSLEKVRANLLSIETELNELSGMRLARLRHVFNLDAADADLLMLCLAISVDPGLAAPLGAIQNPRGFPHVTAWLAARLFGRLPGPWSPASPLLRWQIVHSEPVGPAEPEALRLDPAIFAWLLGRTELASELAGWAHMVLPPDRFPDAWPVDATAASLKEALQSAQRIRVRVNASAGAAPFAAAVSAALGLPLLSIDAADSHPRSFLCAQRQAFLDGCALLWCCDAGQELDWQRSVNWFPLQFVAADVPPAPLAGVRDVAVAVPQSGGADLAAGRAGRSLDHLAQRIECPFEWDDLVVPGAVREALEDFAWEASDRPGLWANPEARRLFPLGRGLIGLFSGPPGTGKTMAAQILARRLDLALYRVDLSAVVSKWVGETSKHLEAILRAASDLPVLLLFDEADALFGKRAQEQRDAQDRYVNMDSGHLLMALESFAGIAVLATNLQASVDHAFLRRLRYVVQFPKPDASERAQIWSKVLTGLAGEAEVHRLALDLRAIAAGVEVTGAQIKNAALGALFSSRRESAPISRAHLLRALNRELVKEGRSLGERERQRLLRHAG